MLPANGKPLTDESLAAESEEGLDGGLCGIGSLPGRLVRYGVAHQRALRMSDYARSQGEVKIAFKLRRCGEYLLFRHYQTVDQVRLHAADFCKKHLLCPLCAIRRGAKMVKAYMDRLEVIGQYHPAVKAYLVTLTVKDGEDLGERFRHLKQAVKILQQARRSHLRGKGPHVEAAKAIGGVGSYEFKRGKGSGLWHPHVHMVWLCYEEPDAARLSAEWLAITGDSFIVDVRPFQDQQDVLGGFLEVFKYAVKFSDLPLNDNWQGFLELSRNRLVFSFGEFWGVQVPDSLTDEPLDDLPFVDLLFRYFDVGYSWQSDSLQAPLRCAPAMLAGEHGQAEFGC